MTNKPKHDWLTTDTELVNHRYGINAEVSETLTYVCGDKTCKNIYINFRNPSDDKTCGDCSKEMERLTEKHLESRPGELEALRKKHGLSKRQMKAKFGENYND